MFRHMGTIIRSDFWLQLFYHALSTQIFHLNRVDPSVRYPYTTRNVVPVLN
jgi:hypothetical protein